VAQATTTRQTADERRVAVLAAANIEFALRGLHGASTDAIARRAGISQPYLFRLFGSKKELFIAVIEDCFARTLESFRARRVRKSARAGCDRRYVCGFHRERQDHAPGAAPVVCGIRGG
jgi:AcrR family transcriptional regulator